jgi:cell division septation protein DedD
VKFSMRMLGDFSKSIFNKRRQPRVQRKPSPACGKPKNGRLIVGVALTIAIMAGLTFLNLRLIRQQTTANRQPVQEQTTNNIVAVVPEKSKEESKTEEKQTHSTPEVTFYKQLKSEDDGKLVHRGTQKPKTSEVGNALTSEPGSSDTKTAREGPGFATPALSGSCPPPKETEAKVSGVSSTGKVYAVQVGIFSHPKVAQGWADKWRSRGYPVALRPMATPNSGVQYRLFLGEFNSEKKADEFAKQFKAKEGIAGLTLSIKD